MLSQMVKSLNYYVSIFLTEFRMGVRVSVSVSVSEWYSLSLRFQPELNGTRWVSAGSPGRNWFLFFLFLFSPLFITLEIAVWYHGDVTVTV